MLFFFPPHAGLIFLFLAEGDGCDSVGLNSSSHSNLLCCLVAPTVGNFTAIRNVWFPGLCVLVALGIKCFLGCGLPTCYHKKPLTCGARRALHPAATVAAGVQNVQTAFHIFRICLRLVGSAGLISDSIQSSVQGSWYGFSKF